MNETQKRRLVGLIVLLAIVFALSELLPHNLPESGEPGVPSTTLPLAVNGGTGSSSGVQAEAAATDAPLPQAGSAQPADAAAPLNAGAAPARLSPSAMPADVSSMHSTAAAAEDGAAETKPSKPAATPAEAKPAAPKPAEVKPATASKPAEAKPAETAKADSKPAPPPHAPALKLAQSLPPPSKPAAPAPAPMPLAKPTPPPVPPMPRLATSVQAPPPAVAAGQGRLWYVQIGSFADQGNAQTTLNLLQNIGFRGESKPVTNPSGTALYRVRLGPFPSEAVALQALGKVSHQGYPQARVLSEAGASR